MKNLASKIHFPSYQKGVIHFVPFKRKLAVQKRFNGRTYNYHRCLFMESMKYKVLVRGVIALGIISAISACSKDEELDTPTLDVPQAEFDGGETEGDQGINQYDIYLTRSGELGESSVVTYSTRDGSAKEGLDYEATSGIVEFASGEDAKVISVSILSDTVYELDESFFVDLFGTEDAGNINIKESEVTIVVVNDDARPVVQLTRSVQMTNEDNMDMAINLALSNPSEVDVVIQYLVHGTAARNSDYVLDSDTDEIAVPAGGQSATIKLSILSDTIPEGGESIIIQLLSVENGEIGELSKQTIVIAGESALNDTGYTAFSDESTFNLTEEPFSHPGQDASFGADTDPAVADFDGENAFSFTKLDVNGNELSADSRYWSCVRDNTTGLVWEVKQDENYYHPKDDAVQASEGIEAIEEVDHYMDFSHQWRNKNMAYYWFNDDPETSGGSIGHASWKLDPKEPWTYECAYISEENADGEKVRERGYDLRCTTKTYRQEMNFYAICGQKNWVIPSIKQLRALADYQSENYSMLDSRYFPNALGEEYYSSDPSPEKDGSAYCFDFGTGRGELCHKGIAKNLRLVVTGE